MPFRLPGTVGWTEAASSGASSSVQYSSAGDMASPTGGTGTSGSVTGTGLISNAGPIGVTTTISGSGGGTSTIGLGGGMISAVSGGTSMPGGIVTLGPVYEPWFPAFTGWLPAVEQRINGATLPDGYGTLTKSEWVSEAVGSAAIRFFQNAADVLPSEPFIYGSKSGALVAEFSTSNGALTTIIAPDVTTLFAVRNDQPEKPIQISIQRGSNRLREDVKNISRTLSASSDGQMGSSSGR